MNISQFIKAKSDQLNADDLLGGPIVVQVERVTRGNSDQPVNIHISGGHCPFRPSKTALRVLAAAWGTETDEWVGRWMELYRDDSVKWAGQEVGGIRISGLSHINGPMTLSLSESRGKKRNQRVMPLRSPQPGAPTADLARILEDAELVHEDVDRWLVSKGKGTIAESTPDAVARLAGWLAGHPEAIEEIRAGVPEEEVSDG